MLANIKRLGLEALAAALSPPESIDYLRFAEEHIVFDEGPFPGSYRRQLFPYFDAVLGALGPDDQCRFVTLQASAQVGKTALATIFALGAITLGRGSFMFVHPTENNALRFSRMKLTPLMNSTAIVHEQFPQRSRDNQSSALFKERKDGLSRLVLTGANSPASLSQMTINAQVQDDVSKFEPNLSGDPESMAESRSRAIADAKIFKISTPTLSPGCRISRSFAEGSQEMPYVPCPHCGELQILTWENMLANLDPEHPGGAHFSCIKCGCIIEEHHRPQMLQGFEWRAQNPAVKAHHRSFWIWSAYSFLQSFEQIAREFLKTRDDSSGSQTFANDVLGKAYEAVGTGRPWEELKARAARSHYQRGQVPQGALVLTLGIDCQMDRIEWFLVGHGRQYRRFVVDYGTVGKNIAEADCQRNLDILLDRKWPNCRGRPMGISLAAIDANFETDTVLAYCRRHSSAKVIAIRGAAGDHVPRIAKIRRERNEKRGTLVEKSKRFFNVGVNNFKMALYRDLQKDDPAMPGYISFPQGLEDRVFQELVSETRVASRRMGQTIFKWEKPDRQPNECLDMMIYASAAAIKHGCNWISDLGWQKLEAEFEAPGPAPAPGDRPKGIFKSAGSIADRIAR